jgi:hypothetical protein
MIPSTTTTTTIMVVARRRLEHGFSQPSDEQFLQWQHGCDVRIALQAEQFQILLTRLGNGTDTASRQLWTVFQF